MGTAAAKVSMYIPRRSDSVLTNPGRRSRYLRILTKPWTSTIKVVIMTTIIHDFPILELDLHHHSILYLPQNPTPANQALHAHRTQIHVARQEHNATKTRFRLARERFFQAHASTRRHTTSIRVQSGDVHSGCATIFGQYGRCCSALTGQMVAGRWRATRDNGGNCLPRERWIGI